MTFSITGSIYFMDYKFFCKSIEALMITRDDKIITGCATGVEEMAQRYAMEKKIGYGVFYADWDRYKKAAGPIRNKKIIDRADMVVIFWDGMSPGTGHVKRLAEKAGKAGKNMAIIDIKGK